MNRRYIIMASGWVGMAIMAGQAAFAQMAIPQYQSATPALSPWLHISDTNTGAVDNYHNTVLPAIQLRSTLQQQQTTIQQQGDRLHGLRGQVQELETGKAVRATGTNSVFMDYGHYYYSDVRSPTVPYRSASASRAANRVTPGR